jgi:hypothetical protein
VTTSELLRKLRRYAAERDLELVVEKAHGKGSHQRAYLGQRRAIIARHGSGHEIPKGTLHAILTALGITQEELE